MKTCHVINSQTKMTKYSSFSSFFFKKNPLFTCEVLYNIQYIKILNIEKYIKSGQILSTKTPKLVSNKWSSNKRTYFELWLNTRFEAVNGLSAASSGLMWASVCTRTHCQRTIKTREGPPQRWWLKPAVTSLDVTTPRIVLSFWAQEWSSGFQTESDSQQLHIQTTQHIYCLRLHAHHFFHVWEICMIKKNSPHLFSENLLKHFNALWAIFWIFVNWTKDVENQSTNFRKKAVKVKLYKKNSAQLGQQFSESGCMYSWFGFYFQKFDMTGSVCGVFTRGKAGRRRRRRRRCSTVELLLTVLNVLNSG